LSDHKAIEEVWTIESTRLIAPRARVTHDIGIAEELAQDALMTALELWPDDGIPEHPSPRRHRAGAPISMPSASLAS